MVQEFWGTLSIYDHRYPLFIRSLVLFDRIVIPIPEKAIYDLSTEEIDRLNGDAEYLQTNDAAIIYPWDSNQFSQWQTEFFKEALAEKSTDSLYDSRIYLHKKVDTLKPAGVYDIVSVPVYGARSDFAASYARIFPEKASDLLIEISQLISVPDKETPLAEIIAIRTKESFLSARRALRDWQLKKMPEILQDTSKKSILLAKEDFKRMLLRYEEAMEEGKFSKSKVVVTSLLALGGVAAAAFGQHTAAIGLLSGAAPNLFSLRQSRRPVWKELRDKPFEAAGVIYEANTALQAT